MNQNNMTYLINHPITYNNYNICHIMTSVLMPKCTLYNTHCSIASCRQFVYIYNYAKLFKIVFWKLSFKFYFIL